MNNNYEFQNSCKKDPSILLIAGEASGDTLGSTLARHLHQQYPQCTLYGMGAHQMRAANVNVLVDANEMSVVGALEVISKIGKIRAAFSVLKRFIREQKPSLVILIDYPGFNLRMATFAKKQGCKTLFYVSPQIWAWRYGRINTIKKYVDHMAVLFPFEKKIYDKEKIPCSFVGHPLTHSVKSHLSISAVRQKIGLDPQRITIGLLPGSRTQEIEKILPTLIQAAQLLKQKQTQIQFVIPKAKNLAFSLFNTQLSKETLDIASHIHLVDDTIYDLLRCCDAVVATSGTVTLEVALMQIPLVIVYKMSPVSFWLAKRLVKTPYIGLCNIVAERAIAKELIQTDATPKAIATELWKLITDSVYRQRKLHELKMLHDQLTQRTDETPLAVLFSQLIASNVE